MPVAAATVADYLEYVLTNTYVQSASTSTVENSVSALLCLQLLLALRTFVAMAFHYPAVEYQTKPWPSTRHDTKKPALVPAAHTPWQPPRVHSPWMYVTIGEIWV